MKSILANTFELHGPFGAKECGEGPQVPITSAIANAIYHATGIRIKNLPINPEMLITSPSNY